MPNTVLLTGASGFLAKHIALGLLEAGHTVRGSIRSLSRADEVRDALRDRLSDPEALDRLSFVALDLASDAGWAEAMVGCDVVMHTASPFPLDQPKNEDEVIRPAVDGTLRALNAATAAGITRVILTSSTVAITGFAGDGVADESKWTELDGPGVTPYIKSKTLAERAAWAYAKDHPDLKLTVINPGFILGPALDAHYGTSLQVIERVLAAKDPAVPQFGFSTVDVRDVADMHVRSIGNAASEGKRILSVADFMWFIEMAQIIAAAYPDRRIVTRKAPNLLIRLLAVFDPTLRQIVPTLGKRDNVSNARAQEVFTLTFRPLDEAVRAAAESVIKAGNP